MISRPTAHRIAATALHRPHVFSGQPSRSLRCDALPMTAGYRSWLHLLPLLQLAAELYRNGRASHAMLSAAESPSKSVVTGAPSVSPSSLRSANSRRPHKAPGSFSALMMVLSCEKSGSRKQFTCFRLPSGNSTIELLCSSVVGDAPLTKSAEHNLPGQLVRGERKTPLRRLRTARSVGRQSREPDSQPLRDCLVGSRLELMARCG